STSGWVSSSGTQRRERALKQVHQNPNACTTLKSSAATSSAYSTGLPTRPGSSSQPKYQAVAATFTSSKAAIRLRTEAPRGAGRQDGRARRGSEARVTGTPRRARCGPADG